MNLGRLILREIRYRKLNFLLGVLSVLGAVGCLVAMLGLLDEHDRQTGVILADQKVQMETMLADHDQATQKIIAQREADTRQRMAKLEDDYRKIGVGLGFNLLILPKDQNLADLYADDYATKDMPEDYAMKLVRSKVITINHVLPALQQKLKWPEQERTIILVGVRGVVLLQNPRQKPIMDTVPAGSIVLGHELHRSMKLKVGDRVKLMDRDFKVFRLEPEKGNKDDITAWINLAEAQAMLGKEGRINAILALECGCAADRLAQIRSEIGAILPDTQVIEYTTQAVARAEARNRATREAEDALAQEKSSRAQLRQQQESLAATAFQQEIENRQRHRAEQEGFAAWLVPVVVGGAAVWIGFLMLANVRERRGEIGILRAIGLGTAQVLGLFLGKALMLGLIGGLAGYLAGVAVACWSAGHLEAIQPGLLLTVVLTAPVLAGLASWLPALLAARQDPALVLREG
jgi:hypothetical protein